MSSSFQGIRTLTSHPSFTTCTTRAGSNDYQSVRFAARFAALQINFFTATAILAIMNELWRFRFASTILNPGLNT